jgi:cell division transport system permease protein
MGLMAAMKRGLELHRRAARESLEQWRQRPVANGLTTAVIGIALALPAGFFILTDNLQAVSANWQGAPKASVFLVPGAPTASHEATARAVEAMDAITAVELIHPDEALEAFEKAAGMSETLAMLETNPLPAVVVGEIRQGLTSADIDRLTERLAALPDVDEVQVDREWLQRLNAVVAMIDRISLLIASTLALAVVLVVGNTIRLDIENRRAAIEISKLIGGTDAFVRRPFLYTGLWYGAAGGLLALFILMIGLLAMAGPARELAAIYDGIQPPGGPGLSSALTIIGSGLALGLAGAWLAVGRHLAEIEPR